ncbi:MAG: hypothetical protein IJX98_00060 [Clostridia bacterium]|nr:hypothetical protein [Clostridia bacterium]
MKKEIDKIISALVLLGFAALWIIRLCLGDSVNDDVKYGMSIAMNVMLILTYLVLLYNAWGAFDSFLFKLVFLVIAAFLILCVVAGWIPAVKEFLQLPAIGFGI